MCMSVVSGLSVFVVYSSPTYNRGGEATHPVVFVCACALRFARCVKQGHEQIEQKLQSCLSVLRMLKEMLCAYIQCRMEASGTEAGTESGVTLALCADVTLLDTQI